MLRTAHDYEGEEEEKSKKQPLRGKESTGRRARAGQRSTKGTPAKATMWQAIGHGRTKQGRVGQAPAKSLLWAALIRQPQTYLLPRPPRGHYYQHTKRPGRTKKTDGKQKKGREGMPKLQVGHKEPKGGMGSSQGQGRCPLGANVGSVDTHTQDLATNPPLP